MRSVSTEICTSGEPTSVLWRAAPAITLVFFSVEIIIRYYSNRCKTILQPLKDCFQNAMMSAVSMLLFFADPSDNVASGAFLLMFVLFGLFILAVVGLVIWLIISQSSRVKKRQAAISEYAASKGYGYSTQTSW